MATRMTTPFRARWSTFILHLTAFLSTKKQDLVFANPLKAVGLVLLIIGAEILLLVVSTPSYLALTNDSTISASKEYKLRRALTVGTVTIVLIVWVIKLVIIFSLVWYARTHSPIEIAQRPAQNATLETAADDVLIAPVDRAIAPPQITEVQDTHKGITISGTALPQSYVVFAFDSHGTSSAAPKFYTTEADEKGDFKLLEDSTVFNLPQGAYDVSAITYDQLHNAKSAESRTFPLMVTESLTERLLHGSDAILNIVALLAIGIGLLATILVS